MKGGEIKEYTNRWLDERWYLVKKDCTLPSILPWGYYHMFIITKGVKIVKEKTSGREAICFYMDDYTVDPQNFKVFGVLEECGEDC